MIAAISAASAAITGTGRTAATDMDTAATHARTTADPIWNSATAHAGTAATAHVRGTAATRAHAA
jgi:hypothetical protein